MSSVIIKERLGLGGVRLAVPLFMNLTPEQLKDLFVRPGLISEADFEGALRDAQERGEPIERVIVGRGLVSDENLGRAIANEMGYRFVDIERENIDESLLGYLPELVARAQHAILFGAKEGMLKLATSSPENLELTKLLERKTGYRIEVYYATPLGIEEALKAYKSGLGRRVAELIEDVKLHPENEEDIVTLVNLLLEYAHDNRSSDIHLEPLDLIVVVRFRIDGVLREAATYPKEMHEKVVFRIKILSRLRTDEHAAAQDGRFDFTLPQGKIDIRVSILPVIEGENVVLRLLSDRARRLHLEELGLLELNLTCVMAAAEKPYGMIIAVGPTGCGKTTTLYAMLQMLNKPDVNIMTIEDPVEYDVERVAQTMVNPKKNLTFATGLRSIVRQDPDIIMVGEIRDNETADIAINAAMTGHLLLSTMHANDAATTFPRLIEMGIEPFLVASSLNIIVAQRLVRKICDRCRASYIVGGEERVLLEGQARAAAIIRQGGADIASLRLFRGAGCAVCGHAGYRGRTGIFEVMEIGEELRSLIVAKEPSDRIEAKAVEMGMKTMFEDGIAKALRGVTTLHEVFRATKT